MNVLIADTFEPWGVDKLRDLGCKVVHEPALEGNALREALGASKCEVLIVRGTKVTEAMLEAAPELGLVVRAGAGFNTIDVAAASRRSILVANCPGKNAVAVAELTFALILGLDRRLVENVTDLRNGVWNKSEYSDASGLKGRTLGIAGLGQIGEAVARRAVAFEMNVVAWSRSLDDRRAAELKVTRCGDAAEVAARCNILTIHLAAAADTKHIINKQVLDRLAPGSYVINTSRAEVVDYQALARAVAESKLRVGLDVYATEPSAGQGAFLDPIIKAGGIVYGTHHIGASTDQAQEAIAQETIRIVRTFRETGKVLNCVNLRAQSAASCALRVRHLNRPGVLAYVLHAVSMAGINVEEMENVICEGDESACAQIKLERPLAEETLRRIRQGSENVLAVTQSLSSE